MYKRFINSNVCIHTTGDCYSGTLKSDEDDYIVLVVTSGKIVHINKNHVISIYNEN